MRPIDADELKKKLIKECDPWDKWMLDRIDNAPTVEQECYITGAQWNQFMKEHRRPHGKWNITDAYPHKVYCNKCFKTYAQENWEVWKEGSLPRNFCPNCGADMRKEADNDSSIS